MNSSNKAIVVVIILGLIAIAATLPESNPIRIKFDNAVGAIMGESKVANSAKTTPQSVTPGRTAAALDNPQNLPLAAPFNEAISSGNKSVDALIKKANDGNVHVQYELGVLFMEGRKVTRDYVTAYMWFNIARANGNAQAKEAITDLKSSMNPRQIAEAQKLASLWWETYRR